MNKQEQIDIVRRMIADGVVTQEQAAKYFPEFTESEDFAKEMFIKALERVEEQMKKGYELTDCDKKSWWEDFKAYSCICTSPQPKQDRKPSEWSEKDETIKNNISHIIRQYDKISKRENQPCYYVGDCLLWMQNIKDRVQPKQEWSKEDKVMLGEIIDFFENGTVKLQHDLSLYASWLKSLRPQNTWKPSDEQMKALNNCIMQGEISYVGQGTELQSLYNDLKKLY